MAIEKVVISLNTYTLEVDKEGSELNRLNKLFDAGHEIKYASPPIKIGEEDYIIVMILHIKHVYPAMLSPNSHQDEDDHNPGVIEGDIPF